LITCLLVLITIGSPAAYNGIISVSIAGLFGSYLTVAALLLYRRCTGGIEVARDLNSNTLANTPGAKLTWGPWRLPGIFGIINNAFSCLYLIFVLFFSFWPSYSTVTPETMNWSIVVTGGVLIFSFVYYFVYAKNTYKGPIVEVEESM
jgi:choline transport protein